MLDMLQNYLTSNVHTELAKDIAEAYRHFELYGLEDVDDKYMAILMQLDEMDVNDPTAAIVEVTRDMQDMILKQHGVLVLEDLPLHKYNVLTQGLWTLQHFDDPLAVLKIAYQNEHPEELFAQLMQLVSSQVAEDILTWLISVDSSLIKVIKQLGQKQEEGSLHLEDDRDTSVHEVKIRSYLSFIKSKNYDLHFMRLIRGGIGLGFPYRIYANILGRDIEELTDHQIADEMICMALIAEDGVHRVREVINQNMEHYIVDPNRVVKIASIVSSQMIEFERYEQT